MSDVSGFHRGMRGGLARLPRRAARPSEGASPFPSSPGQKTRWGDALVAFRGRFRSIPWTLTLVGFLLYVCVITTQRLGIGDVGVILALAGLVFQREQLRFPPFLIVFCAFLTWCALGLFTTPYPDVVQPQLVEFSKLGLIILAAVNALRTRSQVRFFTIFWLACYALYPVRGTFVNYFVAHYRLFGRALWSGIYANPNDLAALTLLLLGVCAGVLISETDRWLKRLALLGVVVLTLLIFMTQSRGALIGLTVFGLFALAGQRIRLRSVALVCAMAVVVAMLAPSGVWTRLEGLTKATDTEDLRAVDQEGSAEQRWEIWQTALQIIGDHPIFGVGWAAYPLANAAYAPITGGGSEALGARDTHSTYLNVTAETGFPGLMLFLVLVFGTIYQAEGIRRRCKRDLPSAARQLYFLETAMVGYMTSGLFGSYSRLSFLYLYLALIYVVAKACEEDLAALREVERRAAPVAVLTS
ncbi:MAG TPA: O-antigen ligase family protein [Longimicrobiaceae bacterium]|nr:O-antigen ligase family protein [Longimicrobiaceae bacterium]